MMVTERPAETPPLDMDELLARCVGNLDFVERVLHKFASHFAEDMGRLERHLAVGDAKEVARLAHTMKGASANVAAAGLQEPVALIEELARQEQLAEISPHWTRLRDEWSRFSKIVAETWSTPKALRAE